MRAPGKIEPVYYFKCYDSALANPSRPVGYVLISPYSDCPAPEGYEKYAAEYLNEVDQLEAVLVRQEQDTARYNAERFAILDEAHDRKVLDKFRAKISSSGTNEWEKEFLRLYLQLRPERRAKYRQRFLEYTSYLWARHNDTPPGRRVDEEKVVDHVDGIGRQV